MNPNCVVSATIELCKLRRESRLTPPMMDQIQILRMDLEFLFMYIWCLNKWNDGLFGKNKHSGSVKKSRVKSILGKAKDGLYRAGVRALDQGEFVDWNNVASTLMVKIQQCKPKIRKDCINLLDCSPQFKISSNELQTFMSSVSGCLEDLVDLKADMSNDLKVQIKALKEKLVLLRKLFKFTAKRCRGHKEMNKFKIHIQAWAYNAACVSLLYWELSGKKEEEMAPIMNLVLSNLLQKIKPCTPEITGIYFSVLKASKPKSSDKFSMDKIVNNFTGFLLQNLQVVPPKDAIKVLHIGLTFLITFVMDPPKKKNKDENDGKLVLTQAHAAVEEAACLISSLDSGKLEDGNAKEMNILLNDFLQKISLLKAEVRKLYTHKFLDSSSFIFPRTNVLGFIDSFLQNLEESSVNFTKHQIVIVQEELLSLRPFLEGVFKLQNEHMELEDLWTRIINVAYQAEYGLNSFLYSDNSLWCDMMCFSDVIEEIILIKSEVRKIQDGHMYSIKVLNAKVSSKQGAPVESKASKLDNVVVGFVEEARTIVDQLIGGLRKLDIVSIVGMAGLGKTTLAKKVYSDPSVETHFHKRAWCFVSQTYTSKQLLFYILSEVIRQNIDISTAEEEDLAERLYRCLKGQRYLIVMDDIWDSKPWDAIKMSFPDEEGSRILFTSRTLDIAEQAGSSCKPCYLSPLSHEESLELLQMKLFHKGKCPPKFLEIGQNIVKNCKWLPLAIVVTAGLLAKRIDDIDWWEQIAKSLGSQIASDGCMHILELSYKHLPEFLKPCFLYFASFPEDKIIRVQKIIRLWISEGFIQKHEGKGLEEVAKEYLTDLVSRSLVTISNRSSNGGIKACQIHDLLREFCLIKGEKEKLLQLMCGNDVSYDSWSPKFKQYRLCIHNRWRSFIDSDPSDPCTRSLLFYPKEKHDQCDLEFFSFRNFKLLQVLDLEEIQFNDFFPGEITKLFLLRYLSLSCDASFLPSSIANLKHLETFQIQGECRVRLPDTIWTMKKLRHFHIGRVYYSFCDDDSSSSDSVLEDSLQLDNLQSFSTPYFAYGEYAEKLLRRLPNVRKLRYHFLDSWNPDLEYNQLPVLDFLSKLESLNVIYAGKGLQPLEFDFPFTLKKLSMKYFSLPWGKISVIGKLPNLEVLKLLDNAFEGEIWDVEDEGFLNLKYLKLQHLNVEQWNAPEDSFPRLERLVMEQCYNLEEIPSRFGQLETLKAIQVKRCSSTLASSVRPIQEEQRDAGNEDLEVHILK